MTSSGLFNSLAPRSTLRCPEGMMAAAVSDVDSSIPPPGREDKPDLAQHGSNGHGGFGSEPIMWNKEPKPFQDFCVAFFG